MLFTSILAGLFLLPGLFLTKMPNVSSVTLARPANVLRLAPHGLSAETRVFVGHQSTTFSSRSVFTLGNHTLVPSPPFPVKSAS